MRRTRNQSDIERFERLEKTMAELVNVVRDLQQRRQPTAPPSEPPPAMQSQTQPPTQNQQGPSNTTLPPQNQTQTTNPAPQPVEGSNIKEFLKLKPPSFEGGINPAAAYEWLAEIKKIFKVMSCTETQRVKLAAYMLKGESHRWWNLKEKAEPEMSWKRFVEVFKEKYIPQAIKDAKCSEFLNLKQRVPKSVADYEAEFTNLSKYGSHVIDTDVRKARKFEDGLLPEIRFVVRPLRLPTYADVVDRALLVEQGLEEVRRISEYKKRKNMDGGKNAAPGNTKKHNMGRTISACATCGKNHSGVCWRTMQGTQGKNAPTCITCGKTHSGVCWRTTDKCFGCGQLGHIQRNCPRKLTGANVVPLGNSGRQPMGQQAGANQKFGANQKPAKAFALTPGDPRNTESVVADIGGSE